MNSFEWGMVLGIGICLLAWIYTLHIRLKNVENKINQSSDAKAKNETAMLSNDELDALLAKNLSTGSKK